MHRVNFFGFFFDQNINMLPLSRAERGLPVRPAEIVTREISIATVEVRPTRRTRPSMACLLWSHVALAAVHAALAISTVALAKNTNLAVPVFHITLQLNYTLNHEENIARIEERVQDGSVNDMEDVFRTQLVPLKNGLPITWLTFAFFAITSFFHLGNGVLWYRYYTMLVCAKFNWLRWLEYSITAPLMWLVIAQAFAFVEVTQLVLSTALIAATMASGITVDWVARPSACADAWLASLWTRLGFMLPGILTYGTAALTLLITMTTSVQGDLPPFLVPTVIVTLGLFESFAIVLIVQQLMRPSWWIWGEAWYLALSLISKAFLGITLIANVLIYEEYACIFDTLSCDAGR